MRDIVNRIAHRLKMRLILLGLFAGGVSIVLFPIIAGLLIVSYYALMTVTSTYAKNVKRQSDVKNIIKAAQEFYTKAKRYPSSLDELKKYYKIDVYYGNGDDTYPYAYDVSDNGQNCVVSGLKTDGKLFVETCK